MNEINRVHRRIGQNCTSNKHRNQKKLVMKAILATALVTFATPGVAQVISDAALAECRAETVPFTDVARCVPMTQVALDMLAEIEETDLLGSAGVDLAERCAETTSRTAERWNCVRIAVDEAAQLRAMVEDPTRIGDPLFADLSDPERQAAFAEAVAKAVRRVYSAAE